VLLKASTTNPTVTFYARNCCSVNTGPTMKMFIGATDNLNEAIFCGKITGIADSTTNVATCTGSGNFVWLRTDGAKTLQVPEFKVEGVPESPMPQDLSTHQPCQASSETHGTTCAQALNGDTRRDHPFQLHTQHCDQWVRVLLKASTTNPKVTFYARNCCSVNTGPTMKMFIGATDDLSKATFCGKITGIADSTTNVASCTGTGKYVWLRTDGSKTLQVPEFKVEGVARLEDPATTKACWSVTPTTSYRDYNWGIHMTGDADGTRLQLGFFEYGYFVRINGQLMPYYRCPTCGWGKGSQFNGVNAPVTFGYRYVGGEFQLG
jgi:hypothetical protein